MADWEALGDRAIRFARPPGVSAARIVEAARAWPGACDVVVARDDVAVYFAGPRGPVFDPERITALAALSGGPAPGRTHELAATYDGEDLDAVARTAGLSTREVIAIHSGATYTVDTMGFAPGFAYLAGIDQRLALPRRATPRPRIAAGSLAIAGGFTAVYPFASPAGWHVIGHVATAMFTTDGPLLRLGDRVRFTC